VFSGYGVKIASSICSDSFMFSKAAFKLDTRNNRIRKNSIFNGGNFMKYISVVLMLMLVSTAHAQLFSRGMDEGGNHTMVYDDIYNLTWLADANYANTSGHNTTSTKPWQAGGTMTWQQSMDWVSSLEFNDEIYGQVTGWRLPSAYNADVNNPGPTNNSGSPDGSELAHMTELVNTNHLTNLFHNIQPIMYWSGTSTSVEQAWMTTFASSGFGSYDVYNMGVNMGGTYAWAVMTGDVAEIYATPLPAASWFFAPALAWLFSFVRPVRLRES